MALARGLITALFVLEMVHSVDIMGPISIRTPNLANLDDDDKVKPASEWREDVGQRYSELKPPSRKRLYFSSQPLAKGELLRRLSEEKVKTVFDSARSVETGCFMLDLDRTCLFGNDGNDLGIALQWMDKPKETVCELYRFLVNPSLRPAFEEFRSQAKNVKVVIYTMRSSLLYYNSNFRGIIIPVHFSPDWHQDGQLYIPPFVRTASELMARYSGPDLIDAEYTDMLHAIERLLAARDAVTASLGLDEGSVCVVVSSKDKDVARTATTLGVRPSCTYLFDDNPKIARCPGVVAVKPYVALDAERRAALLRFLDQHMPASSLDSDLIDFMVSAAPDETVLQRDAFGRPCWAIPEAAAPSSWPVPRLRDGGADLGDMSPVTPGTGMDDAGLADGRRPWKPLRRPLSSQ